MTLITNGSHLKPGPCTIQGCVALVDATHPFCTVHLLLYKQGRLYTQGLDTEPVSDVEQPKRHETATLF